MKTIQLQSNVGDDGVLAIHVPLGSSEAGHRVIVTIERAETTEPPDDRSEWHQFIDRTYGSCSELGLERPAQGLFEPREKTQ